MTTVRSECLIAALDSLKKIAERPSQFLLFTILIMLKGKNNINSTGRHVISMGVITYAIVKLHLFDFNVIY